MANTKNQNRPTKAQSNRPTKSGTPAQRKITTFFKFNCAHILRTYDFFDEHGDWTSTSFDVCFDDVITLYGCTIMYSAQNDKCFMAFPRKKGNDGRYWNQAWIALSNEDSDNIVDAVMHGKEFVENGYMDASDAEELPFD